MTQTQRLDNLLAYLLKENPQPNLGIPADEEEKQKLFRSLSNIRPPKPVPREFAAMQDSYLQAEQQKRGTVQLADLTPSPADSRLYLWQGDITRLAVDAIVNAANSALLGCFIPCHGCIDNAIHTAAGVQLRLACQALMQKQKRPEPTGSAKITPGFNLPAKHVIHTVGPIIHGALTPRDCEQLADCYNSCLAIADSYQLHSIAFCCISTGEFHFPKRRAAEIAVDTVQTYLRKSASAIKVMFNVFADEDYILYKRILCS